MTLYRKSGGEATLEKVVESFYHRMLADPVMAHWFEHIDLKSLKEHQRAFLAVGLDGPEEYAGRSMRNVHAGLSISDGAFTQCVEHLRAALNEHDLEEGLVAQIVKRVEMMRAAIVEPQ